MAVEGQIYSCSKKNQKTKPLTTNIEHNMSPNLGCAFRTRSTCLPWLTGTLCSLHLLLYAFCLPLSCSHLSKRPLYPGVCCPTIRCLEINTTQVSHLRSRVSLSRSFPKARLHMCRRVYRCYHVEPCRQAPSNGICFGGRKARICMCGIEI